MARFLSFQKKLNSDIVDLLSHNIIGTPGKSMVYQQLRTKEKLHHIPSPTFVSLKKGEHLIGTSCFCKRPFENFTSFYIRYFSFKNTFRVNSALSEKGHKNSALKKEVVDALEKKGSLIEDDRPTIFYAYVDPKNERSLRLCKDFGFKKIRSFSIMTFSRFNPKKNTQVVKIDSSKKPFVRKLLEQQYQTYHFYTEENLFFEDNYYLLEDKSGEILAGVQATKEHWGIKEMPGFMGWVTLNILSKLPFIGRLVNSDHYFLAFDYMFCKQGQEKKLTQLMEHTLVDNGVHSGLVAIDDNSSMYHSIKKLSLGPLDTLKKEVKVGVVTKTVEVSDDIKRSMSANPCYISTMDLT